MTAAALLTAAVIIVLNAGIPGRAQFTGQIIAGQLPIAPEVDAIAPPFQLTSLDGDQVDLSALHGNPVVINFWATWCVPCRVEMPALQEVYETYRLEGLRLLAINLGETPNTVQEWVTSLGLTFDVLMDSSRDTAALYYLRGQPSTYVIDSNGVIIQIFYGPVDEATLRSTLAPYFST